MEGVIKNYRRGRHTQNTRQAIIVVPGIDSRKKAFGLVGKKVQYSTESGKIIAGKIVDAHGNSGALRAIFSKGIPGQAIGTKVQIL
jgi:large subunit ribosomal protein L35Ae